MCVCVSVPEMNHLQEDTKHRVPLKGRKQNRCRGSDEETAPRVPGQRKEQRVCGKRGSNASVMASDTQR